MDNYIVIGPVERISLDGYVDGVVLARIDTGARTSAIWVSQTTEKTEGLEVVFFDSNSEYFNGKTHIFPEFEKITVRPSTGEEQERYVVKMTIAIGGRKIKARFTLADRSTQAYPVLVGRNILKGKFVVDVKRKNV